MKRERAYYIAYEICKYFRNREIPNQYKDYEFCMYVADLARKIEYAYYTKNRKVLEQYYNVLNEELENVSGEYKEDVRYLIKLLNECK